MWEKRAKAAEALEDKTTSYKLEEVLDLTSKMPMEPFTARQGASSVAELLADASKAHQKLKAWLAPGTDWANAKFDEYVPSTDQRRAFDMGDGSNVAFAGGRVWDLGLLDEVQVRETIAVVQRYDDVAPWKDVTDVSRILVTFTEPKDMIAAIEHVQKQLEVAWMENGVQNPTCLGYRDLVLGVRQHVGASASEQRVHCCELRFTFEEFEDFRRKDGVPFIDRIVQTLRDSKELLKEDLIGQVLQTILRVMDHTYGRAVRHSKCQYALMDCDVNACS